MSYCDDGWWGERVAGCRHCCLHNCFCNL